MSDVTRANHPWKVAVLAGMASTSDSDVHPDGAGSPTCIARSPTTCSAANGCAPKAYHLSSLDTSSAALLRPAVPPPTHRRPHSQTPQMTKRAWHLCTP